MKKFLIKTSVFGIIGIILLAPVCFATRYCLSMLMVPEKFILDKSVTTLIAGDSHLASGVNPEFIAGAVNISKAMENFFCTYYKLKLILTANPQIENIVLGCAFHNISKYHEKYLLDDKNTVEMLNDYFVLFDDEGARAIQKFSPEFIFAFLKFRIGIPFEIYKNAELLKNIWGEPRASEYPFWGSYYPSNKTNLSEELIVNKIDRYFFAGGKSYMGTSCVMIKYLFKILRMCENRKIRVYLCNTPMYHSFRERVPVEVEKDFANMIKAVQREFPNAYFLDYSGIALADNEYGDGDHLNLFGSKIISKKIAAEIMLRGVIVNQQ